MLRAVPLYWWDGKPDRLWEKAPPFPDSPSPGPLPQLTSYYTDEETARSLFSSLVTALTLGKAGRNTWLGSPSQSQLGRLEGSMERSGRSRTSLLCRSPWIFGPQDKQDGGKAGCWGGGGGHHVWPVFLFVPSLGRLLCLCSGHTPDNLMGGQPVSRDRKMPRWKPSLCQQSRTPEPGPAGKAL